MKDLTFFVVAILALALVLALTFRWLYPHVELTPELTGLFIFAALVLKMAFSWLWSLRKKSHAPTGKKADS
jgi:hypothetical protein